MTDIEAKIVLQKLFPHASASFGIVNLDEEVERFHQEEDSKLDPLVPENTQQIINCVHQREKVEWSFGGWMENRSYMWKGSYLDEGKKYIHLGIDFNLPAHTWVTIPFDGEILHVDTKNEADLDWGTRIFTQPYNSDKVFIFAHLDPQVNVQRGQFLPARALMARLGSSDVNGHVFPHLHLQVMTRAAYDYHQGSDFAELDGYGFEKDKEDLMKQFPDPLLSLIEVSNFGHKSIPTPVPENRVHLDRSE
jgi:hypothetical protein